MARAGHTEVVNSACLALTTHRPSACVGCRSLFGNGKPARLHWGEEPRARNAD